MITHVKLAGQASTLGDKVNSTLLGRGGRAHSSTCQLRDFQGSGWIKWDILRVFMRFKSNQGPCTRWVRPSRLAVSLKERVLAAEKTWLALPA